MIKLPTPLIGAEASGITTDDVATEIMKRFQDAKAARLPAEDVWNQSYRLWRNSSLDKEVLRGEAANQINSSDKWRHRVNTAKTFEVTETLVSYFKAATFPSDEWFEVRPMVPELGGIVDLIQVGVKNHLDKARISLMFEQFARNSILFGVATWRLGWKLDVERCYQRTFDAESATYDDSVVNKDISSLEIDVPSPFDVWLDGRNQGTWCRLHLNRPDFLKYVEEDYFTASQSSVDNFNPRVAEWSEAPNLDKSQNQPCEEVIEFYGDISVKGVVWKNIHAVFLGKQLIRLADSEYWCGSPYVTAITLKDLNNVYGLSSLHPNLGMLHIDNVITNFRLDNLLLHMQGMWEHVQDGLLSTEDLVMEPGKIFKVANKGNLSRLDMGPPNFSVGYNEQTFLESAIDRNMATGPLIGAGQPRRGDRVTAEEIIAVRDSGGNRLNCTHTALETEGTLPMLGKVFKLIQQFQTDEVIVQRYNEEQKDIEFVAVPPEAFTMPVEVIPIGANFVIEQSRNMQALMQLMDISSRSEQMANLIDYKELLLAVMKQLRLPNPSRYLRKQEAPAPQEAEQPVDLSASLGGGIAEQATQQMLATDGGAGMLNAMGVPTEGIPTDQLQGIMQDVTTTATANAAVL
jgi:hypothetical protein